MKKTAKILALLLVCTLLFSACTQPAATEAKPADTTATEAEVPAAEEKKPAASGETTYITIGTASVGGAFYPIGTALATIFNNEIPNVKAVAQATAGSPQNLELLRSGEIQVAVVRGVECHDAFNNTGLYEGIGAGIDKIRCISPLYESSPHHVMVRTDRGINSIPDLKGKKVAVGPIASGGDKDMACTLEAYGLSFDDITPDYSDVAQAVDLMKDGLVDACLLGLSTGAASLIELMQTGDVKLLSFTEEAVTAYNAADPLFTRGTIPANTYPNQPDEIVSIKGLPMCFGTTTDLDDETVYEICKAMYENVDAIRASHALVAGWSPEIAGTDVHFPYHPGAEKFWKEVGVQK